MKKLLSILAVSVFAFSANAGTLDDVKNRGFLKCGVTTGLAGFAAPDDSGEWAGLDADMCRAVAVAVFGDPSKVEFITTTGKSSCLLYTSPSPRDGLLSRMPSSA